jgi:hypothetical protein
MTISELPMEVWSQVAVHVPFSERLRTFHALRCAGCLPDTHTNTSNAFLQFCSEADRTERDIEQEPHSPPGSEESVRILVEMGFNDDEVRLALRFTHGSLDGAMEYLLTA